MLPGTAVLARKKEGNINVRMTPASGDVEVIKTSVIVQFVLP